MNKCYSRVSTECYGKYIKGETRLVQGDELWTMSVTLTQESKNVMMQRKDWADGVRPGSSPSSATETWAILTISYLTPCLCETLMALED